MKRNKVKLPHNVTTKFSNRNPFTQPRLYYKSFSTTNVPHLGHTCLPAFSQFGT